MDIHTDKQITINHSCPPEKQFLNGFYFTLGVAVAIGVVLLVLLTFGIIHQTTINQ